MSEKAIHLKNLGALRFFAAASVMVFHIEVKKDYFDLPNVNAEWPVITSIGVNAVTLFFVLSGFLITYLLLREREATGGVDIGNFYTRRVLRIAPVYYLTIVTGFFLLPLFPWFDVPQQTQALKDSLYPASLLSLAFMSNIATLLYGHMASIDQTWSVSVEQQFYLIWPIVLAFVKPKHLAAVFGVVIVVGIALRFGLRDFPFWRDLASMNRFGSMAIGGFAALAASNQSGRLFRLLTDARVFWLSVAGVIVLLAFERAINVLNTPANPEIYSVFFCSIILTLATRWGDAVRLDGPIWRHLGNLSYSMYMFHNTVIALLGNTILAALNPTDGILINALMYPAAFGLTILLSHISYMHFERRFLEMKSRYAVVHSAS